eukprot:TRINITY_DN1334_c0_g2_i5.p1 TRINITY_DN1334_c0_g2~~TRINITY_DN1334_c0_g2_i5.p1  ORF type:complete len:708 (-),score=162.21 TRINITY_DN1334_c0_g2_i5:222-2108(-)
MYEGQSLSRTGAIQLTKYNCKESNKRSLSLRPETFREDVKVVVISVSCLLRSFWDIAAFVIKLDGIGISRPFLAPKCSSENETNFLLGMLILDNNNMWTLDTFGTFTSFVQFPSDLLPFIEDKISQYTPVKEIPTTIDLPLAHPLTLNPKNIQILKVITGFDLAKTSRVMYYAMVFSWKNHLKYTLSLECSADGSVPLGSSKDPMVSDRGISLCLDRSIIVDTSKLPDMVKTIAFLVTFPTVSVADANSGVWTYTNNIFFKKHATSALKEPQRGWRKAEISEDFPLARYSGFIVNPSVLSDGVGPVQQPQAQTITSPPSPPPMESSRGSESRRAFRKSANYGSGINSALAAATAGSLMAAGRDDEISEVPVPVGTMVICKLYRRSITAPWEYTIIAHQTASSVEDLKSSPESHSQNTTNTSTNNSTLAFTANATVNAASATATVTVAAASATANATVAAAHLLKSPKAQKATFELPVTQSLALLLPYQWRPDPCHLKLLVLSAKELPSEVTRVFLEFCSIPKKTFQFSSFSTTTLTLSTGSTWNESFKFVTIVNHPECPLEMVCWSKGDDENCCVGQVKLNLSKYFRSSMKNGCRPVEISFKIEPPKDRKAEKKFKTSGSILLRFIAF